MSLKAMGGLLLGFDSTRMMLGLLVSLLFPYKSRSPGLRAARISYSSLGHYILEVFKTNECRKCNLSLSTKKEIMSRLLLQTKQNPKDA